MNYIVLDLEWNSALIGHKNEVLGMPFEIIEIGAVKLNEKLNIVSSFNRYVKPQVYKELNSVIKSIISIDEDKLKNSEAFPVVIKKFLEWCGDEYTFCTWGSTDLLELQRNMAYYDVKNEFEIPFIFYDIQKFYSILKEDGKKRSTLENVVKELNIETKGKFHNALNDAHYTALVCKKIDFYEAKKWYSIDNYTIPETRKDEIYARYDNYEKFISRGYNTRETITKDKIVMTNKCYVCGKTCKRKTGWFLNSNKGYYYVGQCEEHGYIKGRLRIKKNDNGKYFAVRIQKITDDAGALKIIGKFNESKKKKNKGSDNKKMQRK